MSDTEYFNVLYDIENCKEDLSRLETILIQLPNILDNNELKLARISLDDTENLLNSIANRRRIKTWKETSVGWFQYLGYIAIIAITVGTLYKIGLFNCIANCMPRKLCLFCVKTKVETPTHVVTYNAPMQPFLEMA